MSELRKVAWKDDVKQKEYPELNEHINTDVAIIGGGITGVITAYLLSRQGKKVVLLEKKQLGEYATKHTTACTTEIIDTDLTDLISTFGKEKAHLIIESHRRAIDLIEEIINAEKIDCEFLRCSNHIFTLENKDQKTLTEEYRAGKELGITMELKNDTSLGFINEGFIEVKNQAKFHPLKFIYSLAQIAASRGAHIYEHSEVTEIDETTKTIKTEKGSVTAEWIVSATYEPFKQPFGLFFKKGMYSSYVFELEIPANKYPEGIYEDTDNPYHYFRIDRKENHDRLIIGGEDHRKDIPVDDEKNFNALQEYIAKVFPDLKYKMIHKWDGPVLEPSDGLAFIGPHKNPHILYAFGFSGNGMTYATIAGKIFYDTIMGNGNPYSEIYRANRSLGLKPLMTKGKDYLEELWNGAIKNTFKKDSDD